MKDQFPFIDLLKGVLIILVVWGHVLPQPYQELWVNEQLNPRFFIYFFHMPLFFAISGFLTKQEKVTFPYAWNKARFLIIVYLIYTAFYFGISRRYEWNVLLDMITNSYNHLWYIAGLAAFYIVLHVTLKFNRMLLLILFCLASLLFTSHRELSGDLSKIMFRTVEYFIYFYAGYVVRNTPQYEKLIGKVMMVITPIAAVGLYFNQFTLYAAGFVFTNLVIIAIAFSPAVLNKMSGIRTTFLHRMGQKTFFIYLTHFLCVIGMSSYLSNYYESLWSSLGIALLITFVLYGINVLVVKLWGKKSVIRYLGF